MTFELIIFIVLVFTIFYNNGVQFYIHQEGYPLFRSVGRAEFAGYLSEYERRLTLPLLLPYALTLVSSVVLLFRQPTGVPSGALIVTLVLNLSVAVITAVLATPVYNRIKAAGTVGDDMRRLISINRFRLLLSTLSSAVVIYLLYTVLST